MKALLGELFSYQFGKIIYLISIYICLCFFKQFCLSFQALENLIIWITIASFFF